ncbi:adenylyl-sulfate kinase [Kribbella sp. NPDC051587]|uniref:adenylyl-sulfate kinase n=1 Tax=Kribbella sp. NPDC051587 TaxID=3364119 RepID=UPI0037A6F95C
MTRGATVWLTGLPSAGKSTVANHTAAWLRSGGYKVEILDGDELRARFGTTGQFARADREAHVLRVGWLARLLARNGVLVLVPVIAPYADVRAAVRKEHIEAALPYLEVHVDASLEVCAARDVKGLYARQRAGLLSGLTGVDDPYEVPTQPELRLATEGRSIAESVDELVGLLTARRLI